MAAVRHETIRKQGIGMIAASQSQSASRKETGLGMNSCAANPTGSALKVRDSNFPPPPFVRRFTGHA